MFGNLGLHVIKFPSGKFGFVGRIPVTCCRELPADRNAIMGQRAVKNARGELVEYRTMVFDTEQAARYHAAKVSTAVTQQKGYDHEHD